MVVRYLYRLNGVNNNFFNVGNSLFKQVKGVSMGCYFSKEISDLVLLYSEYKYFVVRDVSKVIFLKRYADDGIILFSVRDSKSILSELRKIMLFYPSNLVVNIVKNYVTCQYLHLVLQPVAKMLRHSHKNTTFLASNRY